MLTRRQFLQTTAGIVTLIAGGEYAKAVTFAADIQSPSNTLVIIFLRGAMDGIMAVPPMHDRYLPEHRPTLAMTEGQARSRLVLDHQFGLHPSFAALLPLYQAGQLAIIHGVGSPDPSRSHFDAQYYMEVGTPGSKNTRSGWLNRADSLLAAGGPLSMLSLTNILPMIMRGQRSAVAVANIRDFEYRLAPVKDDNSLLAQTLQSMYLHSENPVLRSTANEIRETMQKLAAVQKQSLLPEPGIFYPNTAFGRAMRQLAMLIKAKVGVRVAFVEIEGWDTHIQQGTTSGPFARRADELALGMAGFWQDIRPHQHQVVLATLTEFGRTVRENGSRGTDHGRGSCCFVLGTRVAGGKVYGSVPELATDNLAEGRDLPVTTDFRAIFAEILQQHLALNQYHAVFPGWEGKPMSLWKD